jgi:inosine-uridine nucleoside N-ribohydrolase
VLRSSADFSTVDTDPGSDDVLAILLALASPEIEILAYVVTHGVLFLCVQ